jgi:ABC-type uncharacterized transport system substrate-binding protein
MPIIRQIAILLLSGTAVLMAGAARAETLNVNLFLSDNSPPFRQFADAFIRALGASKAEVAVTETMDIRGSAGLIVAVGMKASELAVTQSKTPVLAVMIPDNSLQSLLEQPSRKLSARLISAIFLNQPWDRQLDFLHAAFPERRRIGLLHSPDTLIDVADLRMQIAKRGGALVAQQVPSAEKLFPSLESVFAGSDLLLAIADNAIYNSSSIRNILLTGYRKGIPLVGLSQSYVSAGALCAVFSTTEQMAGQAGATVISFSRNGKLPDPQYPAEFTISVNQQVARSMGIELPAAEAIQRQMGKSSKR